jgi:hypothetical protein
MRHHARHGWRGLSAVAVGLLLMLNVSLPSARSPQQSSGEPAAARQGRQGRGAGRGAQPRVRKALLAWADTRNGQAQHAFTSHALAIIERLGYDSGLWDTFIRTDSHIIFNQAQKTDGTPASGGPSLSNVDGIFFLGHRDVPITDQQKRELLAFVRSGKGFVAAHTGLTAFESWPEFGEMLGATYGGHLYTGPGRMISEQPSHPIVRHWDTTADYSIAPTGSRATKWTFFFVSTRPAHRALGCRWKATFLSCGPGPTGRAASSTARSRTALSRGISGACRS